jgi:hypothetical protein
MAEVTRNVSMNSARIAPPELQAQSCPSVIPFFFAEIDVKILSAS